MKEYPEHHKEYFSQAYQTGSDIWTHLPYQETAERMLPALPADALVLDIGAGRGLWAIKLIGLGYRVLGIEYIDSLVEKVNQKFREEGVSDRARFMLADATDIPFVDAGFDAVTDIGTFQHLTESQWPIYRTEISRVLKPSGYYLNVSLGRETKNFLGWNHNNYPDGNFTKFGVQYHFFTPIEIEKIFNSGFTMLHQESETFSSPSDPADEVVLVFSLMQKK